jgi:hypothetical protein
MAWKCRSNSGWRGLRLDVSCMYTYYKTIGVLEGTGLVVMDGTWISGVA